MPLPNNPKQIKTMNFKSIIGLSILGLSLISPIQAKEYKDSQQFLSHWNQVSHNMNNNKQNLIAWCKLNAERSELIENNRWIQRQAGGEDLLVFNDMEREAREIESRCAKERQQETVIVQNNQPQSSPSARVSGAIGAVIDAYEEQAGDGFNVFELMRRDQEHKCRMQSRNRSEYEWCIEKNETNMQILRGF